MKYVTMITLIIVLGGCGASLTPNPDEVMGEWEKADDLLPPINLVLSKDDHRILARLRLSWVELSGTALVERMTLRLTFPDRPEIFGEFVTTSELKLRFEAGGPEFLLKKLD